MLGWCRREILPTGDDRAVGAFALMKPKPSPCYLDNFDVWKVVNRRTVWRNRAGDRLFTWDGLHGEIEVFNARGHHLGVADATTGELIGPAVRGRTINVR